MIEQFLRHNIFELSRAIKKLIEADSEKEKTIERLVRRIHELETEHVIKPIPYRTAV